jgi:hypothetical protein
MSTLLKRMLTDGATGESPVAEGDSEGDNAKLPIRYEHGDANSVSLKFCSREELRTRSSGGLVPDGYDAHVSKELVVRRDWLMNADTKTALKWRDAADKLELKDVSVVVRGIVAATAGQQFAAISSDSAGRLFFRRSTLCRSSARQYQVSAQLY